ncbi:glutaredoxin domain-containing protein [Ochrobactrum sp. WV_118_8]
MKPEVLLYVTSWCPYCRRAKALLTKKGVAFTEVDIEASVRVSLIHGHLFQ